MLMARVRALDRKLLRDLWQMRGQSLAIAMVIAGGVGLYVTMMSTLASLDLTRDTYYARYRFGDVFASAKRAPLWLERQIAAIPGVAAVDLRVVADVTVDVEGFGEPVVGRLVSVPDDRRPALDALFLRKGRYPDPGRADEVLLSERFATLHRLGPGDRLVALINGRRRALRVVGIALSPEFIYAIRPGEVLPDDARFAALWMERRALAAAFNMEGGFNDVVLKLEPGSASRPVIAALDRLLAPYGGLGAIPRAQQASNWYLANELTQLRNTGQFIPIIFLAVAAFLVNVVLSRTVAMQREQIGALKALGYRNAEIAAHYVKWSLAVALAGVVLGIGVGAWLGSAMTRMYTDFFSFPILLYRLDWPTVVRSAAIGFLAAGVGAAGAVSRAVALMPADAMRPERPAAYRRSLIERAGVGRLLSQPARMIIRNIARHPVRSSLSVVGIGMGCALLVLGSFSLDAFDVMIDTQFNVAQRYDVAVTFVEPASAAALDEMSRLPAVIAVEPARSVPIRLSFGHRWHYSAITGVRPGAALNRVVDVRRRVIEPPPAGLLLSTTLARQVGATRGDIVTVDVLEGRRVSRRLVVSATVDDLIGGSGYMEEHALHRLLQEGPTLSGAFLRVDSARRRSLYARLNALPRVGAIVIKEAALESIKQTLAEMMTEVQTVNVLFAGIIAFGVVYNTARISLSERTRELATLRVIGFTRAEIAYILLGELALLTLAALPLGLAAGYGFAGVVVHALSNDLFRFPLVITRATYAFAALTTVGAAVLSALVVRRRIDRLDLVEVLKTRE